MTQTSEQSPAVEPVIPIGNVPIYQVLLLVVAVAYGALLAGLPVEVFKDRLNYLEYTQNSLVLLARNWSQGPLVFLSNEPVWLLLNVALSTIFSSDNTLRLFIFVPATLVAWLVLRYDPRQFVWLLLFLLIPQVLKNHVTHLRQGVAIAAFLAGWFAGGKPLRWLLMGLAPLIHSSFFFLLVLLVLRRISRWVGLGMSLHTVGLVLFGAAVGLSLGWLAWLAGARQASEYAFSGSEGSGLGFAFWLLILGVMFFQGREFAYRHAFELGVTIFYLATYFLVEVSPRIFESAVLLVLLAGLGLTSWRRLTFLSLIVSYTVLQYAMRFGEPWLGFGAAS